MEDKENLQSFLERHFKDVSEITPEMLRAKKKEYRKIYLSQYRKTYWDKYIQISFRLTKKEYAQFSIQAIKQGIKVTTLIKQLALQPRKQDNKEEIRLKLLELMDQIEEANYEGNIVSSSVLITKLNAIYTELDS